MTSHSEKYELCVLEGAQQGSRQSLRTAHAQTIGNSFECDIYLHDECELQHQLELLPGRFSISVTLLSGDAVLDSTAMAVGQKYKLVPGVPVRIGDSLFSVEHRSQKPGPRLVMSMHSPADKANLSFAQAMEQSTPEEELPQNVSRSSLMSRLHRPGFLVLFVGFGLMGSVLAAWKVGPTNTEFRSSVQLDEPVQASMQEQPLHEEVMAKKPSKLDIEKSVNDVFRTYGVNAIVTSKQPGVVLVSTNSINMERVAAAKSSAKTDVFGLVSLDVTVENQEVPEPAIHTGVVKRNTPNEFRMIVVGSPSYVVAGNHLRYFEGSRLPTGHRIESITKDKVVVNKNGVTTELE